MKVSIYPGSFDPITNGHIDIIERASKISDILIVSVLNNSEKKSLFTVDERVEMIKDSTKHFQNVEVDSFDGLLVDYAKSKNASIIIRGLRAVTDFEYELQLAQTNRELYLECINILEIDRMYVKIYEDDCFVIFMRLLNE